MSVRLLIDGVPLDAEPPLLTEWQPVEFACVPPANTVLTLHVAGQALEPFLRPSDPAWRWRWNPQNGVGLFRLTLTAQHPNAPDEQVSTELRVVPRKIDQERYTALLADLQQVARELVYALGSGGHETGSYDPVPERASPLENMLALLSDGIERLEQATNQIAQRPNEELRSVQQYLPTALASDVTPNLAADLAAQPLDPAPAEALPDLQRQLRPEGGMLPRSLPTRRSVPSYDTEENRLLKHLLIRLDGRLRVCAALLERERVRLTRNRGYVAPERDRLAPVDTLITNCTRLSARVRALRSLPFLAHVTPQPPREPGQGLRRDPRYREIYRLWRELRHRPLLDPLSDTIALPIHELPRLYEVWSALCVVQALLRLPGAELVSQQLVGQAPDTPDAPTLSLVEHTPLLTLRLGTAMLVLRYQPRYQPVPIKDSRLKIEDSRQPFTQEKPLSAGTKQQPSSNNLQSAIFNLQSSKQDKPLSFDTKQQPSSNNLQSAICNLQSSELVSLDRHVRVPDVSIELWQAGQKPQVWLLDAKYRLDSGGGVPQQALDDAYTYLGSIGTADGQRAAQGALLLFPGSGNAERYPSGVGALPLLPGTTTALTEFLMVELGGASGT